MPKYDKIHPVDFLRELTGKVMEGRLPVLSWGGILLNQDGVIITDDVENEYISADNPPKVIETEYAQELSWLFMQLRDGLPDVVLNLRRSVFFSFLADAALRCIARGCDLTGIALGVIGEATLLEAQDLRDKAQAIKDELLASAGSLQDLAEKI
ncbi:MAG: hypothetical protein IJ584_16830 [Bacteroidales bacterium]|nr:hypothetical protein [Bacteroidales bacterium]